MWQMRMVVRGLAGRLAPALAVLVSPAALGQATQVPANARVSRILMMFDINNDGAPDRAEDSDADGLPDSWETGGLDAQNTDVAFPAPSAIIPGSPPTIIFGRLAVRTSATNFDTDGDGVTDFIEVFGLKFIDDNSNGLLDDACARDAAGNVLLDTSGRPLRLTCTGLTDGTMFRMDAAGNIVSTLPAECGQAGVDEVGEWFDLNGDGMPSIGEFPARNILVPGCTECFDYDGFIFTNPANADTDGDGRLDGVDNDPLVNPRAFGLDSDFFGSGGRELPETDVDFDNDGLGNGMDLGNDLLNQVDNPSDLERVIALLRPDLFDVFGRQTVRIPEALVEDLLGADWNGDGLFNVTDAVRPHFGLVNRPSRQAGNVDLFRVTDPGDPNNLIPLGYALTRFPEGFSRTTYYDFAERGADGIRAPLPWQELLVPGQAGVSEFLPDPRIWTVLYSWRMPGFDIDGNGFIGFDGASIRNQQLDVNSPTGAANKSSDDDNAPSTEILLAGGATLFTGLDGRIECGAGACAPLGAATLALTFLGLIRMRRPSRRR